MSQAISVVQQRPTHSVICKRRSVKEENTRRIFSVPLLRAEYHVSMFISSTFSTFLERGKQPETSFFRPRVPGSLSLSGWGPDRDSPSIWISFCSVFSLLFFLSFLLAICFRAMLVNNLWEFVCDSPRNTKKNEKVKKDSKMVSTNTCRFFVYLLGNPTRALF